jgi:galactose mutarotase-like enzyme
MEGAQVEGVRTVATGDGETATGVLRAGHFGGLWLSSTYVHFTISLTAAAVDVKIEARNVGDQPEPMAVGWHPHFALPSRDRSLALLHVAAERYAVTAPSDGLTTGELRPVGGTAFDFRNIGGAALPAASMNMNFSSLHRGGAWRGSSILRALTALHSSAVACHSHGAGSFTQGRAICGD